MTCHPAYGHYTPLVPLARALQDAGHEVVFATAAPLDAAIREDGFAIESVGLSMPEIYRLRGWDRVKVPPRQGRMMAFSTSFAAFEVPPRVGDLRRLVHSWKPDLIVHESAEYAGPLVAELEGLPSANHVFGFMVKEDVLAAAGDAAAKHWVANGLPPPDRGGMFRGPYLDIVPPSMQYENISTVPNVRHLRPVPLSKPGHRVADWMLKLGAQPVGLVTFGTVFNERPELFRLVIDAMAGLDVDVVVATGA